jgi:2-oxoglutarate dehydrogenase E2 component (dihydrolipoamide succinyltransferase)
MAIDIKSPQFPESIFEGTLSSWLKKEGQEIKQDEVLAEIETDKVVIEVTAPSDGVMGKALVKEGATIKSSEVIGSYKEGEAKVKPKIVEETNEVKQQVEPAKEVETDKKVEEKHKEQKVFETVEEKEEQDSKVFRMGPAAKKLLKEKSLSVEDIKTSSKKGVVTKKDILESEKNQKEIKPSLVKETTKEIGSSERVPMTRLRSVVAKRLLESQSQTASLTTFNEVDLHQVKILREKYKESFEEKFGVKLGFMGMFLKASSIALQEMPIVNASIDGDDIIYHGFQDIGVAVSTERGLVVPVVRNVQNLTIADIELAIKDLSIKARDGKLDIEDMTGGTFTVSNGGVFGSLLSTPILNPPQSAILGMHKIQERPMAINGNVEIRPMMYLALTYDHRLLDGKDAVSFLVKIKEILESPESMILGV